MIEKKRIEKMFNIDNMLFRIYQFLISSLFAAIVFRLAYEFDCSDFSQGFFSGAAFVFMLQVLESRVNKMK